MIAVHSLKLEGRHVEFYGRFLEVFSDEVLPVNRLFSGELRLVKRVEFDDPRYFVTIDFGVALSEKLADEGAGE